MKVRNSNYMQDVETVFREATFIRELGIKLVTVEPGRCLAEVEVIPAHLQHLHRVHGGVISSLAGHAALGAAISVAAEGDVLVAPEFTFQMFRGVDSGLLQTTAQVIKGGALLIFTEAEVFYNDAAGEHLIAKGNFTFTRAR